MPKKRRASHGEPYTYIDDTGKEIVINIRYVKDGEEKLTNGGFDKSHRASRFGKYRIKDFQPRRIYTTKDRWFYVRTPELYQKLRRDPGIYGFTGEQGRYLHGERYGIQIPIDLEEKTYVTIPTHSSDLVASHSVHLSDGG
ncbi:MAG: hypothetical protein HC921_06585 [Synechococcaceae cyanobacterium SM2_3_1]|nr:hypothetical protein [Synechococcaceae cyanobacterium SM2_3_1]